MKLLFVIFIFNCRTYAATQVIGEEQQIVKAASYKVAHWSPHYNCTLHNPGHCTWTKDEKPFNQIQYGFSYEGKTNCSIRANVVSASEIKGLSCVGHINYIHTTMTTGLNENVDLHCESAIDYERCAWKRNDETVAIRGRYSYTHDPLTSQDCSIRISQIESEDLGSWVCSYISKEAEIIEAYTLNNKDSISQSSKVNSTAISTTSCVLPNTNSNRKCEQQRITKTPEYFLFPWSFSYSCDFSESHRCTWLADNEALDPTEHGFFYETKDNCSIRANDYKLDKLHEIYKDISCVGHISYNTTVIGARLNENIQLNCPSKSHTECVWKRENAIVSINGRYSFISNPIETKDCSIRISDVNIGDFGKWTCSDQATEITAAFTVVLKGFFGNEKRIMTGDTTTQSSSTVLIIALSISTSVLLGFIVGLIWKKLFSQRLSSQIPLPMFTTFNTEPTRNQQPLRISSSDDPRAPSNGVNETAIPAYASVNRQRVRSEIANEVTTSDSVSETPLPGYMSLNGERVRSETDDDNSYLGLPLAPHPPSNEFSVASTHNEDGGPLMFINGERVGDEGETVNRYYSGRNPPVINDADPSSPMTTLNGRANEERLIDL